MRVHLHNLTNEPVGSPPLRFDFDKLALLAAESGDVVVMRGRYSQSLFEYLHTIGCIKDGVHCVYPHRQVHGPYGIFRDAGVARTVVDLMRRSRHGARWRFDSFIVTNREAQWAREVGLDLHESPDMRRFFHDKGNFRRLAKTYGLSIPAGYGSLSTRFAASLSIAALFARGFREVMLKPENGEMGTGIQSVTRTSFLKSLFGRRTADDPVGQVLQDVPKHGPEARCIVEGRYPVAQSPCLLFRIDQNGSVEHLATHLQHFNDFTCDGIYSHQWVPAHVRPRLVAEAGHFLRLLSRDGLRGFIVMDAIVTDRGEVRWVDLNVTRTHTFYPYKIAQRAGDTSLSTPHYASFRLRKERWVGFHAAALLEELGPILFTTARGRGVIPYDERYLTTKGILNVVVIGSGTADVEELHRSLCADAYLTERR